VSRLRITIDCDGTLVFQRSYFWFFPHAKEVVKRWLEEGHEVNIVSARPYILTPITELCFTWNGLGEVRVKHVGLNGRKDQELAKSQCDIIIDNEARHLKPDTAKNLWLFWPQAKPEVKTINGLIVVHNWWEIEAKVWDLTQTQGG
jgi:hypothetical protein